MENFVSKLEDIESEIPLMDLNEFNCDDISSIGQPLHDAIQKYGFAMVINSPGPMFLNQLWDLLEELRSRVPAFDSSDNFSAFLSEYEVHKWNNQEPCCLFNMFHYDEIGAKKLEAALESLKEYCDGRMDCRKCIRRGDVAGTSLSRPSSLEGGGVPVGIGLVNNNGDPSSSVKYSPPGKGKVPHNEEGAGGSLEGGGVPVGIGLVNNNGDPSSSVKYSPPGKGKVPHNDEGAGGLANVSGDASGSMNAPPCEGDLEMGLVDLEMGLVNNNGDPPAPGDVPSSLVPHVGHTADRSGEYGLNVAMTVFRVSAAAAAAARTTTSNFAKASYAISLANSGAAILLADTYWKAATPILAKVGSVACGVGVLADMGKDLPMPLFMGAMTAAISIIIAVMVFAKRLP